MTGLLSSGPLSFVHISDSHFGPSKDFIFHTRNPYECSVRVVEIINSLPHAPSFVVHTGDVATNHDPAAYELARDVFSKLNIPIYYATGNHDRASDLKSFMQFGPKEDSSESLDVLSYAFSMQGVRFIVIDARAPDALGPCGLLPDSDFTFLERQLSACTRAIVFGHFPPIALNAPWADTNLLIQNGDALHEVFKRYRERLIGYFYGHIHQSTQISLDGVNYYSVPGTCFQFALSPKDVDSLGHDPDYLPGFNVVTIDGPKLLIRQHTFPSP